jgi:hypothetical protein
LDLPNGIRLLDKIKDAHSAVECLERLGKSEFRKPRVLEAGLDSCAASEAAHPYTYSEVRLATRPRCVAG